MTSSSPIWINEQFDGSGLLQACIATCDETAARECHRSFETDLTDEQKSAGWSVRLRTVNSWDEVPVSALKLSR